MNPALSTTPPLAAEEAQVLHLLGRHTYDEVRALTGWSRGRIYALALRTGARKPENRIRERHEERRRRQQETLQSLLDTTAKADVLDFLDGLPDDSVAMHFTSPPYNLGKKYGEAPAADALRFTYRIRAQCSIHSSPVAKRLRVKRTDLGGGEGRGVPSMPGFGRASSFDLSY